MYAQQGHFFRFFISNKNLARHNRNQKYTLTTKGTKIHEKEQIHFTMKDMKVMKLNPRTPLSAAALGISPLATNPATAGPLDHARRAAGGMLRETIICLHGKPGQFRVPPCIPPPELQFDG